MDTSEATTSTKKKRKRSETGSSTPLKKRKCFNDESSIKLLKSVLSSHWESNETVTYEQRRRSGYEGHKYEDLFITHIILHLVITDNDVEDFKLSIENKEFSPFDDVVLELVRISTAPEKYAIQLKYAEDEKILKNEHFIFMETFSDVRELVAKYTDYKLIIFTSRHYGQSGDRNFKIGGMKRDDKTKKKIKVSKLSVTTSKKEKPEEMKLFNDEICVREHCYHFSTDTDNSDDTNEQNTLDKLVLYTNQMDNKKISEKVKKFFKNDDALKTFQNFIDEYRKIAKPKVLTKPMMKILYSWCESSRFMRDWTFDAGSKPSKCELFKEALMKFDNTILNKDKYELIKNMWADSIVTKEDIDKDMLNKYDIIIFLLCNNLTYEKSQTLLLWLSKKCPLIKDDDQTGEIILFSDIDNNSENIFENLSDLKAYEYNTLYTKILREFTCELQNKKEITLETLIGCNEEITSWITPNELVQMLDGPMPIAKEKEDTEPYITRLLSKNLVKISFLDNFNNGETIIVISNVTYTNLKKLEGRFYYLKIIHLEEFLKGKTPQEERIVLYHGERCEKEQFEKVQEKSKKKYHHFELLELRNKASGKKEIFLEWINSSQDVNELQGFLKQDYLFDKETDITYSKINLICAGAGMGKTTLLKSLKNNSPPSEWAVLITARDYFEYNGNSEKADVDEFKKYIVNSVNKNYNEFEKKLFEVFFQANRISYYWDGLDELTKENLKVVKELIEKLSQKADGTKIFLTSRTYLKYALEEQFNVIARTIKKFDEKDEERFIKERLLSFNVNDNCYNKIYKTMNRYGSSDLLGKPLQIYMMTELIQQNKDKYENKYSQLSKDESKDILSFADLYEDFIDEKFQFAYKISPSITPKNSMEKDKKVEREYYKKAAITLYFDESLTNNKWKAHTEIRPEISPKKGILINTELIPKFLQPTFGEYFAALYLSENRKQISDIANFMFERKYDVIRFFLDLILSKNKPAHIAVIQRNVQFIEQAGYQELAELNGDIKNTLELACSWSTKYKLLQKVEQQENVYTIYTPLPDILPENEMYCKMLNVLCKKFTSGDISSLLSNGTFTHGNDLISLYPKVILTSQVVQKIEKDVKITSTILYHGIRFDMDKVVDICQEPYYFQTSTTAPSKDTAPTSEPPKSMFHLAMLYNSIKFMDKIKKIENYKQMIPNNSEHLIRQACLDEKNEIAKLLLEIGAKFDDKDSKILYSVYENDQLDIAKSLIQGGVNPNVEDTNGQTLMHYSCKKGQNDLLEFLIENGANFDIQDTEGRTPLHYACRENHVDIVETLLGISSINKDQQDKNKQTPLHYACIFPNKEIVRLLLVKGANPNLQDINEKTPLHYACEFNNNEVTEEFLSNAKVEVNVPDKNNKLPIHYVCIFGNKSIFNRLVQKESNLDSRDNCNKQPIHYASENGYKKLVEDLIARQAAVNCEGAGNKTPLHYACEEGHLEVAKLLIVNGADLNVKDVDGDTPIHRAMYRQHYQIVELLIEKDVPLDVPDKYGETILHRACKKGIKELVKILLKKKSNLHNIPNCFNKYPIFYACEEGHFEILKKLVKKYGANFKVVDKDGKTLLHRACERGHKSIAEFLIKKKIDVNSKDNFGKLPIHGACKRGHLEIVELLIKAKTDINSLDERKKTPIFCAHYGKYQKNDKSANLQTREKIMKLLITNKADVKIPKISGKTILHKLCIKKGQNRRNKCRPLLQNPDFKIVNELLLIEGIDLDVQDDEKKTALHLASYGGFQNYNIIYLLIENGAALDKLDEKKKRPIDYAWSKIIKQLLRVNTTEPMDVD